MKSLHLFGAAALALTVSSTAMARIYDSTGQGVYQPGPSYLMGITYPDPLLATARVVDRDDRILGAVQSVAFDDKGHALRVEIAPLNSDHTVVLTADHFLYDPDANVLIDTRS